MDTWDALRSRRNVRQYDGRPIPPEDIDRILEAGWRAPSASNKQSRDYVVVTDRQQLEELSRVWQGAGHVASSAATIAVVYPEAEDERSSALGAFDQGQATMQMMIAAADLGIGSGHSAVGDHEMARRILGYPDGYRCDMLIALGYPADRPLRPIEHPNRRPLAEVVHRGGW